MKFISLPLQIASIIVGFVAVSSSIGQDNEGEGGVEYRLKTADSVLITVYGEEELTTQTEISKTGEISLPLVGSIAIAGKTSAEATAEITKRLSEGGIVVDPKVSVTVTGYAAVEAMVVGSVRNPGPVDLPEEGKIDLLSAIGMAGGFQENANARRVTVRRVVDGESQVIRLDARVLAMSEAKEPFFVIAGDVVSVPEEVEERVTVMGKVNRPGLVEYPSGESLDILSALALAGGLSDSADPAQVVVRRLSGGGPRIIRLDVGRIMRGEQEDLFLMRPRDVVTVGEHAPRSVTVMGEVNKPGLIELPNDRILNILDVIALAGGYTEIANPKRITLKRQVGGEEKIYLINGKRLASERNPAPVRVSPDDLITVAESFF